ncbi:hypothetical protein [Streptomyces endophyticus]|uniref:Uncharacterized protein n=1 Tax=Streptomyces endophyticus TaxID=714166 RepID=A0ABU6FCW5_9ACTN|nr:hypothetical protein [Streptomyces endophyticus]MEB8340647.1 hypothetical protein [Streptomyces endophyticus]
MPDADRHAAVAATADHIRSVVSVLRELDLGDTPPALAYRAERPESAEAKQKKQKKQEEPHAAV